MPEEIRHYYNSNWKEPMPLETYCGITILERDKDDAYMARPVKGTENIDIRTIWDQVNCLSCLAKKRN